MKFHYEFDIKKPSHYIDHSHKLFLIGSCFTENIGEKLRSVKFNVLENPNGILFNHFSVTEAISSCIAGKGFSESDIFHYNEGWHSWNHHSRFSALSVKKALDKMNHAHADAHEYLKESDFLFITLGSAWVYELTESALGGNKGTVVANNHKAPSSWFSRRLLSADEVMARLDNMMHQLFHYNTKISIIFTISPVRHLREGVIDNNRSKAVLIQAVHQLVNKFDRLYYFPAYELVIDDLRDYRFYAEDLVHPNYFATQYVWEKFTAACMKEDTRLLMEEIEAINRSLNHKAFNPSSSQHKKFMEANYARVAKLQNEHAGLDFSRELAYFANK